MAVGQAGDERAQQSAAVGHVRRMNEDAAHKVSRIIANVCAKYPGCVLLFERLRKIKPKGASKSRRMNRRQANQLRGKINRYAKDKAYVQGTVTVEVNHMAPASIAPDAARKGRGSPTRAANASRSNGASCSDARCVILKSMPTGTHR